MLLKQQNTTESTKYGLRKKKIKTEIAQGSILYPGLWKSINDDDMFHLEMTKMSFDLSREYN